MSTQTAMEQVLALPELVDEILQHLNVNDLFRANGVCKKWKSIIGGSRQLQENLFLKPRGGSVPVWHYIHHHDSPWTPPYAFLVRHELKSQQDEGFGAARPEQFEILLPVEPNKILFPRKSMTFSIDAEWDSGSARNLRLEYPWFYCQETTVRGSRCHRDIPQIFQSMLVTQPPVRHMVLTIYSDKRDILEIRSPTPIRYGEIIDFLEREYPNRKKGKKNRVMSRFPASIFCSAKLQTTVGDMLITKEKLAKGKEKVNASTGHDNEP